MDMSNLKTLGQLYDEVKGINDDFMDEEAFASVLNELVENTLVDVGLISRTVISDEITLYHARPGLKWKDFCNEPYITKLICLRLIQNPDTFFVLLNTQKGKTKIMLKFIKEWSQHKDKIVTFMVADNDKSLADQTVSAIATLDVEIFKLSSNSPATFKSIKTHIDAYKHDTANEYKMPVIVLLNNPQQIEKKLKLLTHIRKMFISGLNLKYAELWDEADKTYTSARDKMFMIDEVATSCRTFTCDDTRGLHQLGFVTATEGDLLEDYPECSNACLHVPDIDPEDIQNYRAFHHPESIIHPIPFSTHNYNSYATHVFESNREHFMTPITLPTGDYYRKIIVNSCSRTARMNDLAKSFVREGMYAIVFNGYGGLSLKLYKNGVTKVYRTKGKVLREVLYELYLTENLNDKPIVIIGNRKVDRGVGFHYCPMDGSNGLVWTDIILGKIKDTDTAVQKAGRGSGIVAQCPQYSGETHYWTDKDTAESIKRHNTIVDRCAEEGYTAQQAVRRAEQQTSETPAPANPHKTVPILIEGLTVQNIESLRTSGEERKQYLLQIIRAHRPDLMDEIIQHGYEFRKITLCEADNSYKKHITDVIVHVRNNTPYDVDFSPDDKRHNCMNVFIDKRENRVVIVRYKGLL